MSFPQLLRRSAFASHDPAIQRVYTSSQSSVSKYGDWGLKYPIHRKKGPKNISVSKLDAGKVVQSDWRSAEKEARFMEAWGQGGIPWVGEQEPLPQRAPPLQAFRRSSEEMDDDEFRSDTARKGKAKQWVADVDAMTPREFERYLESIRAARKDFGEWKVASMHQNARAALALDEDRTVVSLAANDRVVDTDPIEYQARLANARLEASTSDSIAPNPHGRHGLQYSRTSPLTARADPQLSRVGRALSQAKRNGYYTAQTNNAWTVGLGGVTATMQRPAASIRDKGERLSETDFSRVDTAKGVGRFGVLSAKISAPPSVVGQRDGAALRRYDSRGPDSASLPRPMDTFRFDIKVEETKPSAEELGSREWVGREPPASPSAGFMGLGQRRSDRVRGAATEALRREERELAAKNHQEESRRVSDLLAKMGRKALGAQQ